MYQVIYYSRSGNTRKVAEAIAGELGVRATGIASARVDPTAEVLFLGSGRYAGSPGVDMQRFIEANDFRGRKIAYFGTCWLHGLNKARDNELSVKALEKKGAIILGDYRCKGKFLLFNPGRPNESDLDGARKFARDIVKQA